MSRVTCDANVEKAAEFLFDLVPRNNRRVWSSCSQPSKSTYRQAAHHALNLIDEKLEKSRKRQREHHRITKGLI